jgi:ribosome-binding protein aMBF1 (putative translation factor)
VPSFTSKYGVEIFRPGDEFPNVSAKKVTSGAAEPTSVRRPSKRPSPLQRAFAANLMAARELAGLSQRDLARLIDGSQNQISEIENCTRNVTFRTVTRLARALKVSEFVLLSPDKPNALISPTRIDTPV